MLWFEANRAVIINTSIFSDITPCSPLKIKQRFGGISPPSSRSKKESSKKPAQSTQQADELLFHISVLKQSDRVAPPHSKKYQDPSDDHPSATRVLYVKILLLRLKT
jgi:hypothetical protein